VGGQSTEGRIARARRIHSPQQFVVVAFSRWCEATDAAVERINPLQRG